MFKFIVFLTIFASFYIKAQTLFQPADETLNFDKYLELQSDPLVVPERYRLARMNQNEIFRSINYDMPLVLNLFNDVEIRANVQKTKELAGGSSFISGDLEDGGHFTIFLHNSGIIRGELHSIRGVYTLKSEGVDFNQVLIKQEDLSDLPRCGNDLDSDHAHHNNEQNWIPDQVRNDVSTGVTKKHHVAPAGTVISAKKKEIPAKARASSKQAANNTIDVLVVYTQRVEDHEGGPAQVRATIESEVAEMNYTLENSGLAHRHVKLAGIEKVDYIQSSNHLGSDRTVLAKTSEDNRNNADYSALDEVYPLIEKYKADLVHLFVKEPIGACGIASIYSLRYDNYEKPYCEGSENYFLCMFNRRRERWKSRQGEFRFSVSSIECTSSDTFTHELGHSLGLWHNRIDREWKNGDI
ncbi:MAG: M12 family metallo-peptidase, partial [Bdellovibrionales bacterium]|nr:M12 family metallo-peptidase [Bdellovibrionales bacterium]